MQWETSICWEVGVESSVAPKGTISSSCEGNIISLFRHLILLNHCSKETEVNLKHANGILNKGNKDISQIYLFEHSMLGNMVSFGGSVDWPSLWHPDLGQRCLRRKGKLCSFTALKREMKPETWGNPILCVSPMLFKVVRRKKYLAALTLISTMSNLNMFLEKCWGRSEA